MRVLKSTISDFIDDDCTTMAAALAYYTLFALPSLLLVIISIIGMAFGRAAAEGKIEAQIQNLMGSSAGKEIGTMVGNAGMHSSTGVLGIALGLVALGFGATTAFAQLQTALNWIWHVKPDPNISGVKSFLARRFLSFLVILAVAVLLLVSLALSAVLGSAGNTLFAWLPSAISKEFLHGLGLLLSFLVIAFLFAAVYKMLPDANLTWRQVRNGALVTSALFTVGKFLIGLYLGKSGAASAYGAAGSLVLIVLWIYYSSIIVLLGAEFTRALAKKHGERIDPKEGAVCDDHGEDEAGARQREPAPAQGSVQ